MFDFIKTEIHISKSSFFALVIFFFAFYKAYLFSLTQFLEQVVPFGLNIAMIQGILYFFTAIVLLLSSFFIQKFNKLNIIYMCSIINCLLTVLLFGNMFEGFRLTILFVLVLFVSVGMLATLGVFGSLTVPEERGRVGGLIGFIAFVLFYFADYFFTLNLNFLSSVLFILLINALPLCVLFLKSFRGRVGSIKTQRVSYYEKRVFFLYFIPWIIFSLLNAILAKNTSVIIQQQFPSLSFSLIYLQLIGFVFGVMFGGLIADLLGRRFSLVFSLTLYGFGTALVGLFVSDLVFLVVGVTSGLSWGFLFVLYLFVVWGDLSNRENRLKVYSIGVIPYFLSLAVGSVIELSMPLFQSALLSVMFIFLLNMPIIFAPELLPLYVLDKIRMKRHMGDVKKLQKKGQG